MIRIVLYPPLSKGRQTLELPMADEEKISVPQLIEWLQSRNGEFPGMVDFAMTENPEQNLMILVNDKLADARQYFHKGDTIKIVPNMSGG